MTTKQRKSQLERFKEAARELGTDDDEARFNERLKKLVKEKPKDDERDLDETLRKVPDKPTSKKKGRTDG